jgi:small-conductance mechanosensitive channel
MYSFWDKLVWGNAIRDWAFAVIVMIISILLLRLFRYVVLKRLKKFSEKSVNTFDDFVVAVIQTCVMPLLYGLVIYFSLQYLIFDAKAQKVMHIAIMVISTFFVVRIITSVISYFVENFIRSQAEQETRKKQARGILIIIKGVVWMVALVFLVDNFGYDITTIITGLGIGGIAIALAAQTILGDLFSYLVIFFDKPFEIGDFIIVDDKMGTVEYIGIKTTRLRTLSGEQLVCSNTDLTNSRVHNYKRMERRRVVFNFGVVYGTPAEKLQKIPLMMKAAIEAQKLTQFDRAHFLSFGAYSLDFEVVYYVLSADYNQYMDIQQNINLQLFTQFEEAQIEFAFPTQTVLFDKASEPVIS